MTEYFAARPFSVGQTVYKAGNPVPVRQPGDAEGVGVRAVQVVDLRRLGYLTTAPLEILEAAGHNDGINAIFPRKETEPKPDPKSPTKKRRPRK